MKGPEAGTEGSRLRTAGRLAAQRSDCSIRRNRTLGVHLYPRSSVKLAASSALRFMKPVHACGVSARARTAAA
jgi:hypothetical protein